MSPLLPIDAALLAVAALAVFVIAFMKGAFGGGFAIVGIPLLSLATDPITAGVILAPLLLFMDICALANFRPATWSWPDLAVLVPGSAIGVGIGFLTIQMLDKRLVAIGIALITLAFAGHWYLGAGAAAPRPRSRLKGLVAGAGSGFTTMVAHAGGPPLAIYLLPLGLPKLVYAGTTSMFFLTGNVFKAGPWLAIGQATAIPWAVIGCAAPMVPLGVWAGWRFHQSLDQARMLRWLYALLVAVGFKLLWDGVRGFL